MRGWWVGSWASLSAPREVIATISLDPPRTGRSRRTGLALVALLLLNLGVLAVGLGSLLALSQRFIAVGRAAELVAAVAFGAHAWPRARSYTGLRSP